MAKTVKVRIAVAVDPKGHWQASGWRDAGEEVWDCVLDCVDDGEARFWITAELPIPESIEVQGKVEKEEPCS